MHMAKKEKSNALKLLTGYEYPNVEGSSRSAIGKRFYARKVSGRVTQNTKRFLDSRTMKVLRSVADIFSYTSAKAYGAFLLAFGLLSLVIQFVKDYFEVLGGSDFSALIIGVCIAIVSITLLLVDTPVSVMLERFRPTEIIFFEFFCIKRLYYTGQEKAFPPFVAGIAGGLLALLSTVVPLWCIALGIGILLFVALTFLSPEFSFFSTLLFLPYFSLLPSYAAIIGVTALIGSVSFVRKTIFGKRVIFFEQYDLLIGIFVLIIFISGVFNKGIDSFTSALLMASIILGYFLAGNTITNRRLADCAINAVAYSSLPAAVVSFVSFFTDASDGDAGDFLEEGISSTFLTPGAAAAFFIVAIMFSLILAKESHRAPRLLYSALAFINLFALILTGQMFALFALLFAVPAYFALKTRGWLALWLPLIFGAAYFVFLIPESALSVLPSALYEDGSIRAMKKSLYAFLDHLFLGIGIGGGSFSEEMADYGVSDRTDSGNLFLELGLEAGVFALAVFVLLIVVRLIHRASYQRYIRPSQVGKMSPMVSVTIFSLLIFGCFDYIFADMSILYLFFSVFGIASATLRVAKQEHDDRVLYFEDEKSSTSSVVNIHLR